MREMRTGSIHLTVTSPPYDDMRIYDGFEFQFEEIANQLYRLTKPGGVVVWVVGDKISSGRTLTSFRQGLYFQSIGFNVHDVMIYQKQNTPFMRSNAYTNCYEFMYVLSKGAPKTFNPLLEPTVRSGYEMLTHNKLADGVNKKTKKTSKKREDKNEYMELCSRTSRKHVRQDCVRTSGDFSGATCCGSHLFLVQRRRCRPRSDVWIRNYVQSCADARSPLDRHRCFFEVH